MRTGYSRCSGGGSAVCSNSTGTTPEDSAEICDAKDNDCDGLTDEELVWTWDETDYPLGEPCEGIGACGVGVVECSSETNAAVCSTNSDGSNLNSA